MKCVKGAYNPNKQDFRSTQRRRATRPLEIIHSDVCGPVNQVTWDRKRYFITFLDDYTHYFEIQLLETKEEAQEAIKKYIMRVEAKWNSKASTSLKAWRKKKGIVLDYTVPYFPQLNGKAERLNRTLVEKARALISDSKLDKEMWGEAVRVAAYLTNRSPSLTVKTTPHEMWTDEKPNLARIKLFGCEAYAKILTNKNKLDNQSERLTMVGYTLNGYRLWNSMERKITVHRDVIFNETKFNSEVIREEEPEEVEKEYTDENPDEIKKDMDENTKQTTRTRREAQIPKRFEDYVLLTYEEVINSPDKKEWNKAIEENLDISK